MAEFVGLASVASAVSGPQPVTLELLPSLGKLILRGRDDVRQRASEHLGCALPDLLSASAGSGTRALRLGPDAYLLLLDPEATAATAGRLHRALAGLHHAVVEVSDRFEGVAIDGVRSREVLNAGCALDLHPRAFPVGRTVRTLLAKATVILTRPREDDRFELFVDRSLAPYLWLFLTNAALEHGYETAASTAFPRPA